MLSLFYGNDTTTVRQKAFAHLEKLTDDDTRTTSVTVETYVPGMFTELAGGASLFGGTELIVLDTLSDDAEAYDALREALPTLEESKNQFIVIEGALTAADAKTFAKHASHVTEAKGDKEARFNTFALTDAFLHRDKKSLWLLLQEAWRAGVSNEELIGVLFWQVKVLRLAARTASAEEAGQKPFVYQKAKRALTKFKKGELDELSRTLLTAYHDGHSGRADIELALERWVLQL